MELPAGLEEVPEHAFSRCRALRSVVFRGGSTLRAIWAGAFEWTALEDFSAPPGLREIGMESFYGCRSLRSARLNEGLEALGADEEQWWMRRRCGVFQSSGLERVWLPSTLRVVGMAAFRGCKALREVRAAGDSAAVVAGKLGPSVQVISEEAE